MPGHDDGNNNRETVVLKISRLEEPKKPASSQQSLQREQNQATPPTSYSLSTISGHQTAESLCTTNVIACKVDNQE